MLLFSYEKVAFEKKVVLGQKPEKEVPAEEGGYRIIFNKLKLEANKSGY